ncbi:aldose epimerase family protein [Streptomyces sp. NBC_01803]|uniref:aldose epimerase family protein n=1 Tax=Streptomyces sp. NBC_01803 TaxID=2975946 RepID=UPI002DDAFBE4|nr:aldose 1-epimerase [Streptomyces sp. NBC_01803]WSA45076.1 aldose 1-epimerase [Streptomyces sp. NBC_01803]
MTTHDTERGIRLSAADTELVLLPDQGGRIASLRVAGTELLRQGEGFGSFVMAPWCGRTAAGRFRNGGISHQLPVDAAPHAIHGTVRHRRWRTARADARSAALVCDLTDPWPYPGRVTQTVELAEDGTGLTLTLGVETHSSSFPAQAGWHPWFRRTLSPGGRGAALAFTADWQEERGEDHLPTGRRITPVPGPWDDCFGMSDGVAVTLTWPDELEVTVNSRSPWVVIYDEMAEAVCVEPQSGPPNGLNTHPRMVTPLEPLEISTTWTWRGLS